MSSFVRRGGSFVHGLAMTSVQLFGHVPSASLSPFRPHPSLAAGLPHFATKHMRCWGRDTSIGTIPPGLVPWCRQGSNVFLFLAWAQRYAACTWSQAASTRRARS